MTSRPYDQIYTKLFRLLRFESTIRLKTEDHGREIDADIQSFISQSEWIGRYMQLQPQDQTYGVEKAKNRCRCNVPLGFVDYLQAFGNFT